LVLRNYKGKEGFFKGVTFVICIISLVSNIYEFVLDVWSDLVQIVGGLLRFFAFNHFFAT